MNDQIQNQIAEIYAVEDRGSQIKLGDKNKRSLGSFFKEKKAGGQTVAYSQFLDMGIKSGSVVEIGFKEVPYKDGTIKNIISFREANQRPLTNVIQPQELRHSREEVGIFEPMPEEYPQPKQQDAFGRRLALHGMINARLNSHTIQQVRGEIDELLALEDYINEKLN